MTKKEVSGTLKTEKGKPRKMKVNFSNHGKVKKTNPQKSGEHKSVSRDEEKKLVVKKPLVELDDEFRKFVREVKKVLIEKNPSNISPTYLFPFLKESIKKYNIKTENRHDTIALALGYIYARRIPIANSGNQPLICLGCSKGGALELKIEKSLRWEEVFQSFKEDGSEDED